MREGREEGEGEAGERGAGELHAPQARPRCTSRRSREKGQRAGTRRPAGVPKEKGESATRERGGRTNEKAARRGEEDKLQDADRHGNEHFGQKRET